MNGAGLSTSEFVAPTSALPEAWLRAVGRLLPEAGQVRIAVWQRVS